MTSTVTRAAILLVCFLTLSAAQSSCKDRCGEEYNRGYMCQCDYSCLVYGECCPDYEYQCTTRTSCKGRCGEKFKRGQLCSCDPDCMKYKQCCTDVTNHCDTDEMSGTVSAAEPGNGNSCHNVNDNKPKEPVLKDATDAMVSDGNNPEDSLPLVNPSEYPNGDEDSFNLFDDDFLGDGVNELEPNSLSPDLQEPQSTDVGPQDSGILSSTASSPTGTTPTEATATTAQPQTNEQAGEQSLTDSTPEPESTNLTSGDLPEAPTIASNPPEATTSTSTTQPSDVTLEATSMPSSSPQEPESILEGTSAPNAEDVTAIPFSQDNDDQTAVTNLPTEEAQDDKKDNGVSDATFSTDDAQTRGDDVPQNPVTQDSDGQETTTHTANRIVQGQDQSNVDTQTEATSLPGDAQTHLDDDTLTSRPQDIDDQATTTTQPIDQGQDDALPETTHLSTDALTNGDDVTSIPLPQDVDDQKTTPTMKPTDQELDDLTDDALIEATPDSQTGDATKSPTDEVQDGTTAETTPEISTADPLNITPDTTKVTWKPQDKPVPSTAVPVKPDQDMSGTKPEVKPLSGNIDDTTGYQGDASNDTNLCNGQPVSAVTTLRNGTIVVFRGHFFWLLDRNMVPSPARGITQVWGIPSPIDTVFTRCNCQGKTYIFKGPQYWRFENDVLDSGYPKPIATGFDGLRGHITAALSVPQYQSRRESVYFFKRGGLVQKYSYQFGTTPTCGRKPQYSIYTVRNRMTRQAVSNLGPTISIRRSWRGFPTTVTAAVSVPTRRQPEGFKYFVFSRTKVYNMKMQGETPVAAAAPATNTATQNNFFKCPKKV